ncbi:MULTISPECIES: anti-sigma factor [unclassified Sinorhizobium]|uniref:anti-sigma factor family protein n=1 Tax=unclassified Sinorhizobium TaxID=2613772 RepID=UPI00352526F4
MSDLMKMPLDAQLSALLSGETTPEQKEELERRISADAEARRIYDRLRRGAEFGRRRFEELLKEPVPLAMVRSIKSAQPPKAPVAPRLNRPSLKLAPTGPQALAAALILFVIGCGLGYLFGLDPSAKAVTPVTVSAASNDDWLADIAAYQRIFSRQPRHLVEIPASMPAEISNWLTTSVGVPFTTPDLSADGLQFQGARLLLAGGKPAGLLVYKNSDGDVISICFTKQSASTETDDFKEMIKDDIGLVSWHNAGAAYVVVGPSSEATLDELAGKIAAEI